MVKEWSNFNATTTTNNNNNIFKEDITEVDSRYYTNGKTIVNERGAYMRSLNVITH